MGSLYAKDVIKIAQDWLGYEEGPDNWTIFAKVLDDCDYFKPQKKQNVAWCAIFCDFCAQQAAIPEDRDNEAKKYDAQYFLYQPSYNNYSASANAMASYFKNNDAFYDDPKIGDMIFFKDAAGNIVHVGIVENVYTCITTIEGNAGDMVQRKYYDFEAECIAGFGRPRYDRPVQEDESSGDPNETIKHMEQIINDIRSLLFKLEDLIS